MTSSTIRDKFLKFFSRLGHIVAPSSSLVPSDDSSVLLTIAGMQQFKPYFSGSKNPLKAFGSRRITTSQRCFRTSDIEEVGDESHLTFFEMLGNFSFADYFKEEAITYAFTFLNDSLGIAKDRLWGTYFSGEGDLREDDEARTFLLRHLPEERVRGGKKSDNWWGPTGSSGPCGPSAEIHVELRDAPCERKNHCVPGCPCGRFIELWNLVFTEFYQDEEKKLTALSTKNIDTGMGLERLSAIVQSRSSVFETDLYAPLIRALRDDHAFGKESPQEDERRLRIVSDHLKGAFFLLADGVRFSNKDQGYILRRVFRRALDQFLSPQASLRPYWPLIREMYKDVYPHLKAHEGDILAACEEEEASYRKILSLNVDEVLRKHIKTPGSTESRNESDVPSRRELTAVDAFKMYSSYGISPDRLTRAGYTFSMKEFQAEVERHQNISRAGSERKFGGHGLNAQAADTYDDHERWRMTRLHTATHLVHQALRLVLGNHVRQQGSDITPERLRFDFEHPKKLTPEELERVESLVNSVVSHDLPVTRQQKSLHDALAEGALAFFKEKYPEMVTVYSIGDFSKEICGGPHVEHTAQVGPLRITSEKSSAAGIRRIKAEVGEPT